MDPIRFAGIGSGLDLESLVQNLLRAEMQAPKQRLQRTEKQLDTQQKAISALSTSARALNDAADALRKATQKPPMAASHAENSPFQLQTSSQAGAGSFGLSVEALASAHRLRSGAFAAETAIGHGTLTLSVGGNAFSVDIDPANATAADIAAAINGAADNTGVRALAVNGADGTQLVFSALNSGAGNALTITADGGDGGLEALRYTGGPGDGLVQVAAARDAEILLDGVRVTASGNVFADVLPGVTIDVLDARPGQSFDVTIGKDTSAMADAVEAFVKAYNATQDLVAKQTRYDAATQQAGPLQGDAGARGLAAAMRNALGVQLGDGEYALLSQIGLNTSTSGRLSLDRSRFENAVNDRPDAVVALLSGSDGLGSRVRDALSGYVSRDGLLATREQALAANKRRLDGDRQRLDLRAERVEQRLRNQFAALDSLMSQLQNTSNFLFQQLG